MRYTGLMIQAQRHRSVCDYSCSVAFAGEDGVIIAPFPFCISNGYHNGVGNWLQKVLGTTENKQSFFSEAEIFSAVFSYIRLQSGKQTVIHITEEFDGKRKTKTLFRHYKGRAEGACRTDVPDG